VDFLKPHTDPAAVRRVRAWAAEVFAVGADGSVAVTELRCSEPGCPPLETVIVIAPAGGETSQRKLHKPVAEISRGDLETLKEGQ